MRRGTAHMERKFEHRTLALILGVVVVALASASFVFRDVVIYNGSHSMPVGFYIRETDAPIQRGAVVTTHALTVNPEYARARAFVDRTDRFIKWVAAVEGDEVCASGPEISINGVVAALRAHKDNAGRTLPRWNGCVILDESQVFLLGESADSFDGRYWGPIHRQDIEGVWRPL